MHLGEIIGVLHMLLWGLCMLQPVQQQRSLGYEIDALRHENSNLSRKDFPSLNLSFSLLFIFYVHSPWRFKDVAHYIASKNNKD